MKRGELVEKIIFLIKKNKLYTTIDVNDNLFLCVFWNNNKSYIQVEGFDSENIYIRNYTNLKQSKQNKIIKIEKTPYKILKKLYEFLKTKK
jgi:hypothetical protein